MLVRHRGATPTVDPSAYVAPSAVLVGAVHVAAGARILHGAVVVGRDTVVMEQALVRGRRGHDARLGDAVLVGPHAHVNGSTVEDEAFVATGAALFPGSRIGTGAEVRVHGVVQVNTVLPPGALVPIGWVAVGDPAQILPPDRHDDIWAVQRELDFPGTVYGVGRDVPMRELMRRQAELYGAHRDDEVLPE